ncbi:MAG: hypothetical protein ABJG78_13050 [Cyclobacteriaceae bacterium]
MRSIILLSLAFLLACSRPTKEESKNVDLEKITIPIGDNASLPYLITGEDESLYFSWVEKKDSGWVELKYSKMVDNVWSAPAVIARGNDWFVNWADYPMVAVDSDGNMLAHYLAKSASGTYAYDVNIVMKKAGESVWSDAMIPHDDNTPTEHGFATMLPQGNGSFQISWLDGRNTGGGDHESHGGGGAMTIRTAVLDMDGNLTEENVLDQRVCDCCQTTGANTTNGPVVLYRDRSEMEIRDLSIVRKINQAWTKSVPVYQDNWNIAGCPVNGPRVDAAGNTLAVAWYSAANNQPEVKVAFSSNGGETFDQPIMIDQTSPLGRVDLAMINEQKAIVSWLTSENGKTVIKTQFVEANGALSEPMNIAETSESRGSGFPQLEKFGDEVYVAWTVFEDGEESEIKMIKLPITN